MLLFAALLAAAAIPAGTAEQADAEAPAAKSCPSITSHYAIDRSKPLTPQKLTELPPGKTYMAVYRRVDGCEFPMTMVEYRTHGRRR